jgi:hypothetical protein
MESQGTTGTKISERFSRLGDDNHFDRVLWANQSDAAKFLAVYDSVLDYLLITTGHRNAPRLDRTVESFQRR